MKLSVVIFVESSADRRQPQPRLNPTPVFFPFGERGEEVRRKALVGMFLSFVGKCCCSCTYPGEREQLLVGRVLPTIKNSFSAEAMGRTKR